MNRRNILAAGLGAAALAAGAGWSAWQRRALDTESGGLWDQRFPTPDGGELVMAHFRGRPLVLNFWATWCPPCVKEMPELDRFHRSQAAGGARVVGLAVDGPTPVREFLTRVPISFPIGLAGFEGTDLSRRLGNAQGALPFTAVFGADGRLRHRKLGETSVEELQRWLTAV
jgi:thiol-disulfide isomerase/thioredoxin